MHSIHKRGLHYVDYRTAYKTLGIIPSVLYLRMNIQLGTKIDTVVSKTTDVNSTVENYALRGEVSVRPGETVVLETPEHCDTKGTLHYEVFVPPPDGKITTFVNTSGVDGQIRICMMSTHSENTVVPGGKSVLLVMHHQ